MAVLLDDNFEEYINYLEEEPYAQNRRKIVTDRQNPLNIYTEHDFFLRYRMKKNTFAEVLMPIMKNYFKSQDNRGCPIPHIHCVLAALRFFGTGSFQLICGDLKGISQSKICTIVNTVAEYLCHRLRHFVALPQSQNEILKNKENFYQKAGFPGVVGVFDGTHIPIKSPGGDNAEVFRNRKGWMSINVQIIAGPNEEILDIVCRWPGSTHDARMFENSSAKQKFSEKHIDGLLLGDSGYPQSTYLFTPVPNPQSIPENNYNKAHILTRNVVERTIGIWKRKFPCLTRKLQNNLKNSIRIIVASSILYNISRKDRIVDEENITVNYENEVLQNTEAGARGAMIRNAFIQRHFN